MKNVFIEPSHDTPLVWFEVVIPGGAAADPFGMEGLHRHAALFARRGAGTLRRAELDAAFDQVGATVDIGVVRDSLTISGTCLSRHTDTVWGLIADIVAAPRMDDDEHERLLRETPQMIDELRDDDGTLVTRWFDVTMAPGHVYARTTVGTTASVSSFTVKASRKVWQEAARDRVLLGFAGDITEANAHRLSEQLLTRLPSIGEPLPDIASPGVGAGPVVVLVDKPDRTQSQLRLGHPSVRWGHPDTPALLLAETAFGGMFSSRLMQEIRVKRGWSYGAGSALRRSRGEHWFEIWMATGIEVTADAAGLTQELLASLVENGLRADELDFVRNYVIGSMPFQLQTAKQRLQMTMKDALWGLSPTYTQDMVHVLADVTNQNVTAAMQAHYRPNSLVTVAVTTAADTRDQAWRNALGPVRVVAHDAY